MENNRSVDKDYIELLNQAAEKIAKEEVENNVGYKKTLDEYGSHLEVHDGNLIEFPIKKEEPQIEAESEEIFSDKLKKIIESSVSGEKRGVIEKWGKRIVKIIVIAALAITLKEAIDNYQETLDRKSMINNHGSEVIAVMDEAGHWDEDKWLVTNYDSGEIANYLISDLDNFDTNLFHVYRKIRNYGAYSDEDIRTMINNVLDSVKYRTEGKINYEDFADYVTKHHFVDENGNPDYNAYYEYMENYIVLTVEKSNIDSQLAEMTQDGEPGLGGR